MKMQTSRFIKDYFTFSRSQSYAIIVFFSLILLINILYYLWPVYNRAGPQKNPDELNKLLASIQVDTIHSVGTDFKEKTISDLKPFVFDPNKLDREGFVKMGMREKLINTLMNYRNKGGRFYKPDDLAKIWGLRPEEFRKVRPFIRVNSDRYITEGMHTEKGSKFSSKKTGIVLEINSAGVRDFQQLKGIGEKRSANIIRYRELLGGFVSVEQLKEVYGISPELYLEIKSQLKVDPSGVKKMNINELTWDELKKHPVFRGNQYARVIVEIRKKHHYEISDLEQLKESPEITQEVFDKIVPYLALH